MNCIRLEFGSSNARYVQIQDKNAENFTVHSKFYSNQLNQQLMSNILINGQWGSYRHLRLDQPKNVQLKPVEHAYVDISTKGDLTSLRWVESPLRYQTSLSFGNSELCTVYYAALNFK